MPIYNEKPDQEDKFVAQRNKIRKKGEKREQCHHEFSYMFFSRKTKENCYCCIKCGHKVWC